MAIASIIKRCLEFRGRLKVPFDRNKPPITLLEPPGTSLRPVTASLMKSLPAARADCLGVISAPESSAVCAAFLLTSLALLPLKDISLIIAVGVSVVIATKAPRWLAETQVSEQTNDVLGSGRRIAETLALPCLVSVV